MHEYICRAKRKDNGQWIKGYYCRHEKRQLSPVGDSLKDDDVQHLILFDGFADWNMPRQLMCVEILPETLGAYTGETDCDGKRVFTGDCFRHPYGNIGIVKFGQYNLFDVGYYRAKRLNVLFLNLIVGMMLLMSFLLLLRLAKI